MPYRIKECAGEPYRPSNGTEGEIFMSQYCERCTKEAGKRECGLIVRSLSFDVDDPEYPKEWTHDSEGRPTCTAFVQIGEAKPMTEAQIAKRDARRGLLEGMAT